MSLNKNAVLFRRDSGFVQPVAPADRKKRRSYRRYAFYGV